MKNKFSPILIRQALLLLLSGISLLCVGCYGVVMPPDQLGPQPSKSPTANKSVAPVPQSLFNK